MIVMSIFSERCRDAPILVLVDHKCGLHHPHHPPNREAPSQGKSAGEPVLRPAVSHAHWRNRVRLPVVGGLQR